MSQEQNNENSGLNEDFDSTDENLTGAEVLENLSGRENSEEIDNLPIESIGSYARLEELQTDEEKGNTTNPTAQS